MKYSLFLGSADISDLLIYLSKFLQTAGRRVLLVDASTEGFIRYNTPIVANGEGVSEYDEFDIGYAFTTFAEMKHQLDREQQYDHVLVLCSQPDFIRMDDLESFKQRFVVMSPERRSLERAMELMSLILAKRDATQPRVPFCRLFVQQVDSGLAEDYMEQLLGCLPIVFEESSFTIPFDEADYMQKIVNQNSNTVSIKRISRPLRTAIQQMAGNVSELDNQELKSYTKKLSRRSQPVWGM
ncbi:hypothetical protein SK066_04570 [Paenibacillus hunanensis]|uniref:hypothetical protein n=1 Tax=Paenibacillus hunanensis TaxID=539262 RepID=UPI002A6B7762|nr:hypothetical protein [Paenibacillus hunanensis]WPP42236.1 hypothetical protein SK066_04570 [Paenibacillus hunanensis]